MGIYSIIGLFISQLLIISLLKNEPQSSVYALYPDEAKTYITKALSWMTLRENGVLMTKDQLAAKWMDHIKDTQNINFIAAFQFEFEKLMTLKENDACDPTYRLHYQYWFNESTNPVLLFNLVIKNYYRQHYPEVGIGLPSAYCDYTQGLVCNKVSKKCECPPGSKMSRLPSAPFPPAQRCLVQENEVCAVLDTAYNGGTNDPLKDSLPFMIFDPERPLGCVEGTQCRFKSPNLVTPLCYSSSGNPAWVDDPPNISIGEECTLYLYAPHGVCDGGLTCYNYGLKSTITGAGTAKNKTGICSEYLGVYGGPSGFSGSSSSSSEGRDTWYEYKQAVIGLVTPALVPLRGDKLYKYQIRVRKEFQDKYLNHFIENANKYGCSVGRTDRMIAVYQFFLSLHSALTNGGMYVADEAELNKMLDEAADIVKDGSGRGNDFPFICDVRGGNGKRCVATGKSQDRRGNDGECSQPFTEGKSFHDDHWHYLVLYNKVKNFKRHLEAVSLDRIFRRHYSKSSGCSGSGSCTGLSRHRGYCFEDYGEFDETYGNVKYKDYSCDFVGGYSAYMACKGTELDAAWEWGACEQIVLEQKIEDILEAIFQTGSYKKVGNGGKCNYFVETLIKEALQDVSSINGYNFLKFVDKNSADNDGLCDMARLLECKSDGKCGCVDKTQERVSDDEIYKSDYCYLVTHSCDSDVTKEFKFVLESDEKEMMNHYGDPNKIDTDCKNSNVCVFVDAWQCTTSNTGVTGVDRTTTPPPGPGPAPGPGPGPGPTGPGVNPIHKPIAPARKYSDANILISKMSFLRLAFNVALIFFRSYNFM